MNPSSQDRSNRLEDLLNEIDNDLNIAATTVKTAQPHSRQEPELTKNHKAVHLQPSFILYINENETQAILKYTSPSPPRPLTLKAIDILDQIKKLGYTYGLLEKNIKKAISVIQENPKADVEVIVAQGRPATEGIPAQIEYWIGNEEFAKRAGTVQARKNDLLIRISSPKPGIPGIRLTGEVLEPPPMKALVIHAGEFVRKTPEGEYYAERAGTVVLKDNVLAIFEVNRDAEAFLSVSEDGMQALLTLEPPMGNGAPITREHVQNLLTEAGVWCGIQSKAIEKALQQANHARQPVHNAVIAIGQPPSAGRDASVIWHIHPKMQRDRFIINEDGSVDFYNQNNILTVTEGDHLLTFYPSTQGRNGIDVYGQPLNGRPGKSIPLEAGPNIQKRNEGTEWYAACTGLYRLHHNILEVQPMFFVKGDVDFSIGNIDFNGDVVINGNVLDGFEVRANGAISVIGTVEAAILEAGKCVEVKNGIFGKEKGRVTAGKNVVSFFLQNAEVRAGNDVIIGNQILNSRVYARRHVEIRSGKGTLLGGLTVAGFGIRAKTIGSEYGVRTVVEAGTDFTVLERMIFIGQKEKDLNAKLEMLENVIEQELRNRDMTEEEKDNLLDSAYDRKEAIQNAIDNLRAEYKSLASKLYVTENPLIVASDQIMPDVYVHLHDAKYKFRSPVRRATVDLDPETRKIRVTSKTLEK